MVSSELNKTGIPLFPSLRIPSQRSLSSKAILDLFLLYMITYMRPGGN